MRVFFQILFIALSAVLFELFFPWWWGIAIAAALGGYLLKSKFNFLAGFIALFMMWGIMAWMMDNNSSSHLTDKVASLFSLSKNLLILITSLLGGLVGGVASLTGSSLRMKKRKDYYR